jgi:diguanylate cyclase (GGDEF)-like protein
MPTEDAIGRALSELLPFVTSEKKQGLVRHGNGTKIPVEVSMQAIEEGGPEMSHAFVLHDRSERVRLRKLAQIANHDALTGLFNRHRFDEELAARLAETRRYGTPGALLLIDLDNFKPINDKFGHQAGDALLKEIGRTLQNITRDSDVCARLGGDEFVVLLTQTNIQGARACAIKILDQIAALSIGHENNRIGVRASIGIAGIPEHGKTPGKVLAAADRALYLAKGTGRNRIAVYPHHDQPTASTTSATAAVPAASANANANPQQSGAYPTRLSAESRNAARAG